MHGEASRQRHRLQRAVDHLQSVLQEKKARIGQLDKTTIFDMDSDELCVALSYVTRVPVAAPATASGGTTVRLFVALEFSPEVICRLSAAQATLRSINSSSASRSANKDRNKLRYVEPALMHVTVKFIGEVSVDVLPSICAALEGIPPCQPFLLSAGPVVADSSTRPRTLWSRIADPSGSAARLQAAIDAALVPLGIARERRKFLAHITVARVTTCTSSLGPMLEHLAAQLQEQEGEEGFGSCIISGMKLKSSTLSRSAAPVYRDLLHVKW